MSAWQIESSLSFKGDLYKQLHYTGCGLALVPLGSGEANDSTAVVSASGTAVYAIQPCIFAVIITFSNDDFCECLGLFDGSEEGQF